MDASSKTGKAGPEQEVVSGARLLPRITIQAFCEHSQTARVVETAVQDRRMSKVALTTHNGGMSAAIETYKSNPTPNLIIIEINSGPEEVMSTLERLAEVCDAGTRLVILGTINDVIFYRKMKQAGVSEYLVLPTDSPTLVTAICDLFVSEGASPIGRTIGFVPAKGGVGSSTIAHNVAWMLAQSVNQDVLILDMDLAFGTAGLNFNQDPPHGLGDAVFAHEKMDQVMLDRLMAKAAAHINLLAAPGSLERTFDFDSRDFEQIIELSQRTVPLVILDIPHTWNGWVRHTLGIIDEIVIVAEPDLANLRNTKNLIDTLKVLRTSESEPLLVLNQTGVPKRPEISSKEFAASVGCKMIGEIASDAATFGTAANNGQMLAEVSAGHKANEVFNAIGLQVTGRSAPENLSRASSKLPLLSKLLKRA